ncbi:MAG TPA: cytochrome d ubiquinol oxidase subunit II [bacterium]|nr:cytochrome d ubiquinol oxidase subunit II [bacterium]
MITLQIVWYLLVGVLLTGYAILDGFDLGAGFWHLIVKKDSERRLFLNAIGPVWDGNEVWLITGGGALFAAFPPVYASVFSGMYLALILLLFGLILRAVSLEYRSQLESPRWREWWDKAFAVGSMLAALLFGVALGNILRGLPLNENGDFTGTFFTLLNPYALLIGLLGFAMIAFHGALYLAMKVEGDLAQRLRGWANATWRIYLALFALVGVVSAATQPQLFANYLEQPVLFVAPLLAGTMIVLAGVFNRKGREVSAFLCSSLGIVGLWGMVGAALFPNLVPALNDPALSLTLTNSSSGPVTLKTMLVIAVVFVPIVLGYTAFVYRSFAGKVSLEKGEY